jgi:hypothetical protein
MKSVVLFSMQTEGIKIIVEAYFDATNNLVIDGYDIGKTVEEYWGDSDYEYSTTIKPDEVKKLCTALNLDSRDEVLSYLQFHYHANDCYSKIQALLDQLKIQSESFSWR